jgi:hypothetical protein
VPFMEMRSVSKPIEIDKNNVNKQQNNEVKITDKKNIEQTKGGVQQ